MQSDTPIDTIEEKKSNAKDRQKHYHRPSFDHLSESARNIEADVLLYIKTAVCHDFKTSRILLPRAFISVFIFAAKTYTLLRVAYQIMVV